MPNYILPKTELKQYIDELTNWIKDIPDESIDWAESLVAAALDEAQGKPLEALRMAKAVYKKHPKPPA